MKQEKVLAQGNKDHLKKLIERSTQDLHHRVNMQGHLLLTVLGGMRERILPYGYMIYFDIGVKKFDF